jgi:hypothetical protein
MRNARYREEVLGLLTRNRAECFGLLRKVAVVIQGEQLPSLD